MHNTANFLGWHRYYMWQYEKTLKEECGFKGTLPYYDWARWADDPLASPLFDGSETSISGNGAPYPQRANQTVLGVGPMLLHPLTGLVPQGGHVRCTGNVLGACSMKGCSCSVQCCNTPGCQRRR